MSDETQKKNSDDHEHHSYHNLAKPLLVTAIALSSLVSTGGAQNRRPPNDKETQKTTIVVPPKDTSVTGKIVNSVKTNKDSSTKRSSLASNPLNAKKFARVAGFENATYLPEKHAYIKATNVILDSLAGSSNDFLLSYTMPDASGVDHNYMSIVRKIPSSASGLRGMYYIPAGGDRYGKALIVPGDNDHVLHIETPDNTIVAKDDAIDGQQR